jgi:hypothetical protein
MVVSKTFEHTFQQREITLAWFNQAHRALDSMYGDHDKIMGFIAHSPLQDWCLERAIERGYRERKGTAMSQISTRDTQWYSHYRVTFIEFSTGKEYYEIGFQFKTDTDAIQFKLSIE